MPDNEAAPVRETVGETHAREWAEQYADAQYDNIVPPPIPSYIGDEQIFLVLQRTKQTAARQTARLKDLVDSIDRLGRDLKVSRRQLQLLRLAVSRRLDLLDETVIHEDVVPKAAEAVKRAIALTGEIGK